MVGLQVKHGKALCLNMCFRALKMYVQVTKNCKSKNCCIKSIFKKQDFSL